MMTPEVFVKAIASIEQNYGLRLDARSVWLRMDDWKRLGRDQMGQKCGRGWQGLRGACKRVPKGGDKDAAIKASKVALADKIRKNKGLRDRNAPKAELPKTEKILPELNGSEKQVAWAKTLRQSYSDQADRYIDTQLASIAKRVKDPERIKSAKEEVWEEVRDKHLILSAPYASSWIDSMKNKNFEFIDPNSGGIRQEWSRRKDIPESYRDASWMAKDKDFKAELKRRGLTEYAPEYAIPYLGKNDSSAIVR